MSCSCKRRIVIGIATACLLVIAQSTVAFVNFPWWSTQLDGTVPVTYRWGSNLQGTSLWKTAFEQARDDWNTRNTKPRWHYYPSTGAVVLNTYYNSGDGAAGYMEWPQSWYWN